MHVAATSTLRIIACIFVSLLLTSLRGELFYARYIRHYTAIKLPYLAVFIFITGFVQLKKIYRSNNWNEKISEVKL